MGTLISDVDLKPDNVMVKLEDPSILERDARDEYDHPLPQKHGDGRTISLSRNKYGPLLAPTGVLQITDFDLSVSGTMPHTGCIQAEIYRAPEVILDAGYTYSADIWSLGVMVRSPCKCYVSHCFANRTFLLKLWDLLEGKKLFNAADPSPLSEYDDQTHLAQITALLGPPPGRLLTAGRRTSQFYRPDGTYVISVPTNISNAYIRQPERP